MGMISRYEDPVVADLFSREQQLRYWRAVELTVLRHLDQFAYYDAMAAEIPTETEVETREEDTGHEFTAFLDCWVDRFPHDSSARRWIHYGLTSSDVIDTASAMQHVAASARIRTLLLNLIEHLDSVMVSLEGVTQIGRTHGQWAVPRDATTPWRVMKDMLKRADRRLSLIGYDIAVSDLSGPVGQRDVLADDQVKAVLRNLGLRRVRSTQIVPRDGLVRWANELALTATVCEAIATQYRLWIQSGIDEFVIVPTEPDYTGSSSMPHKTNPSLAENVCGLARLARAAAVPIQLSVVQWGDRDLAHSSVERVAVPDLCHLVATALDRTRQCTVTYAPNPSQMRLNLGRVGDSYSRMNQEIQSGKPREQAYKEAT